MQEQIRVAEEAPLCRSLGLFWGRSWGVGVGLFTPHPLYSLRAGSGLYFIHAHIPAILSLARASEWAWVGWVCICPTLTSCRLGCECGRGFLFFFLSHTHHPMAQRVGGVGLSAPSPVYAAKGGRGGFVSAPPLPPPYPPPSHSTPSRALY